jgi:DNA mismatch repair protein MutH
MKFTEYLVEVMRTFLDDQPEMLAAYIACQRLSDDPVMWEKIQARERLLTDIWLNYADAYAEGQAESVRETASNMMQLE